MHNYAASLNDLNYTGTGTSSPAPTIFEKLSDIGVCYLGTGTTWQTFYTDLSGSMVFEESQTKDTKIQIIDIQELICSAFSLSMAELAIACHKSRKTLYDWRDGSIPRPSSAERLFHLYRSANDWLDSSGPIPKARLREPLLAGHSLFELLCADNIDLNAIAFLRRRLDLDTMGTLDIDDPFA